MSENILLNTNTVLKRELDEILRGEKDLGFTPSMTRIDEEVDISPEDFIEGYVKNNRPVIIRKAIKKWPATRKWSFEYFGKHHGETEVTANLYNVREIKKTTLEQLAKILAQENDSPTYLQEWWFQHDCPELMNDIKIPPHFSNDENLRILGFHNNTLWAGQEGAFTPIHQDTVHANVWTAQIMGKKEWVLIDPSATLFADESGKPDYSTFFKENTQCIMKGVLAAGDLLYVPYKWWHRANTIEDAISLNTFFITPSIVKAYIRDVMSIPLAASLNAANLQELDPMRYNICIERSKMLANLMGLDAGNILSLDASGAAKNGIYAKAVA